MDLFKNRRLSEVTKRLYGSDIERFRASGGRIPCSPEDICKYLNNYPGSFSTHRRFLAALSVAHQGLGIPSPTVHPQVKNALREKKKNATGSTRQVSPLIEENLSLVIEALPKTLAGLRDRAILLLGFHGALRRCQLSAMQLRDIRATKNGLVCTISLSSGGNRLEQGVVLIPPSLAEENCPIRAIKLWASAAGIKQGKLFRSIDRHGNVGSCITSHAIARIIKNSVGNIGLDEATFSGHSLRSGWITTSMKAGKDSLAIRKTTKLRSELSILRYHVDPKFFRD